MNPEEEQPKQEQQPQDVGPMVPLRITIETGPGVMQEHGVKGESKGIVFYSPELCTHEITLRVMLVVADLIEKATVRCVEKATPKKEGDGTTKFDA